MTKADIVNEIAKSQGIEKIVAQKVIDSFMNCVSESLVRGESVFLRGFGTYYVKERAEKTARDILKNVSITVPAHKVPAFRPAKALNSRIKFNK